MHELPKNVRLKALLLLLLLSICQVGWSQSSRLLDFNGWKRVTIAQDLPLDLTSSRCAVIISIEEDEDVLGPRPEWGTFATRIHRELRKMHIDPVCYVFNGDVNAGPEIKNAFIDAFVARGISNIILFEKSYVGLEETYSIKVASFNGKPELIARDEAVWLQENVPFNLIFLRLGRKIIGQNLERTNHLIPERPNLIEDLPLFTGAHFKTFPGSIRRSKLAVIIPEKYEIPPGLNPSEIQILKNENLRVERKIQEIKFVMSQYPYSYELVPYATDEVLTKQGFQYALLPFYSSGSVIKNMLNYKVSGAETDFISVVPKDSLGVALKTIPVNQPVFKYYIRQTIAHDVYVGKEWDSDLSWESAMTNFIINLKRSL